MLSVLGESDTTASMRPQHDAAENAYIGCGNYGAPDASMRPQHDAAENGCWIGGSGTMKPASMRPQHDAAENLPGMA